jgi:alkylation response protein AidB-like acyl-CoA dehydrogenase
MRFVMTANQRELQDAAARMARGQIQPILESHDDRQALPKEACRSVLQILAEHRLTAARIPSEAGGAGIGMLEYGLMFEQLPPQFAMTLLAHEVCAARLHLESTEDLKRRLLPDLIAGRRIGCTGSTEPDTGSDPRAVKTRLVSKDGLLRLFGRKMWITNVPICDIMIVTCLDNRGEGAHRRIVKVVLERSVVPFETRPIDVFGLQQSYLGEAVFDGCVIPEENVIESPSGGTTVLKQTWLVNRPLIGLIAVHLAQAAFEIALEYGKTRQAFGKHIGAHQLVQKNLSDMATEIEASRLLCYRALDLIDHDRGSEGSAAMAKRYAQDACERVIRQAMNVLGALGLSREARLERMYRDVRMLAVPDGTNEILTLMHGRELTGFSALR